MAEEFAARRVTMRSPWAICGWLLGAVGVLLGLAVLGESWDTLLVTGVGAGLPGLWTVARVPFMRVTLTQQVIIYHGYFRNQSIAWSDISAVTLEEIDEKIFMVAFAPTLRLKDGDEFPLNLLAGYTTPRRASGSRMAKQVRAIENCIAVRESGSVTRES